MSAANNVDRLEVEQQEGSKLFKVTMQGICLGRSLTLNVARRLAACWNAFDGVPTEKFEGKSVAEYIANEAYITGLVPVAAGGMELGLSGDACQLLAESFAGQFKGSGGINFIEVQMRHKDMGPFTVTIQRQHGETPAQQKAAALKELDSARTLLSDALETFDEYMSADHEVADRIRAFLKGGAA